MYPETVLITGSNRGIGLQLVKDFLNLSPAPKVVITACRNPDDAKALHELKSTFGNLKLLQLDLLNNLDEASLNQTREEVEKLLQGSGLNLLINNAGVMPDIGMENVNIESLMSTFQVNTFAPLLLTKALLPLLKKSVKNPEELSLDQAGVVNLTSHAGSIQMALYAPSIIYNGSKTALNMFTKNLSIEYGEQGILFLSIHPGAVDTDMMNKLMDQAGRRTTLLSTLESSQNVMNVMAKAGCKDRGKFMNYNGAELPW